MAPMYILARDINNRNTTAAMRLRLIRTYDIVQSRYSDKVRSRECVFHDEEGSYVHLNIPGNNVSVTNSFIEGHVYCIKNFLSFDSIKSLEGIDEKVLIDVIGRVVQIFSPLDKLINGRPFKLIDFVIEDLKGIQLKCTAWDQHVEKVMPFCQSDLKEPVIVLIQMCRVKVPENSGEVKICSSYDATQLLFNQDCYEFTDFRKSLGDQSNSNMVLSTISELFERSETGEYWVPCIILELDCNLIDWYYLSCIGTRCNKKVVLKGGMYVCGKCGTHCDKPKLRYKIKIRVYDANGNAPFLLWDREALELLASIIAEELKAMQPKRMIFKINVQRDRLEKRNLPFLVMQIKEDIAVLNQYYPGLVKDTKQKGTNSVEPLDDDLDSDAGFFSYEEAESPLPNALTQMAKGGGNESEAVKRRLLDEFSSTQCLKKKTHTAIIKMEKDSELGGGRSQICSSYDATQLLFNQDCYEFTDFRKSLGDQSNSNMVLSTISELFERSETGEYWVPCIILELDCNLIDWYYLSCIGTRCNKKVVLKGGMYVCGKCGTHCDKPKLRYKIKIRVYDANGNAPFLLWDREALELLASIIAEELKAMQPKVPTKIPKEIESLVVKDTKQKGTNSVEPLDDDLDSDAEI
nr:replication factor A protein 1-like [Ipomoea batatas]